MTERTYRTARLILLVLCALAWYVALVLPHKLSVYADMEIERIRQSVKESR